MRVENWLAERAATLLNRAVRRMPAARRDWGIAVAAELAAVPAGRQRLRWSLSGLWFVLRHARARRAPAEDRSATWVRRASVLAGVILVAPWLLVSILQLTETDAPDIAFGHGLLMAVAEALVVGAFLANWRPSRGARAALLVAVSLHPVAIAVAASDRGSPLLAALIFGLPVLLAAVPVLRLVPPAATPPAAGAR